MSVCTRVNIALREPFIIIIYRTHAPARRRVERITCTIIKIIQHGCSFPPETNKLYRIQNISSPVAVFLLFNVLSLLWVDAFFFFSFFYFADGRVARQTRYTKLLLFDYSVSLIVRIITTFNVIILIRRKTLPVHSASRVGQPRFIPNRTCTPDRKYTV